MRDDIVILKAGDQIYADAEVVSGQCKVNESLLTGESDEIQKSAGDSLMSGSFVSAGECVARITAVGRDAYANKIILEAGKGRKPKQSEMMRSLSSLVKWIGIIVIPFGVVLCVKEVNWLGRSWEDGIVSTVAAVIGMIPEGLYLLTSLALTASVLRLAQKKTLVHEMGCIEALARVDTLCVDKTGTITENKMVVEDIALLCEDRFIKSDISLIMADYVYAMKADNDTMAALRKYFTGQVNQTAIDTLPFTSAKKYGGVSFHEDETYLLGAPDVILGKDYDKYKGIIEDYSSKGCRVLLLCLYDGTLNDEELSAEKLPVALILLSNKIRAAAPATFKYFEEQDVRVKVISGDNALTVSEVAKRAGIRDAEKFIDARELKTDAEIAEAAEKYNVFGRVTPEQKKKLVMAMKKAGHTVAMTGDGVNDVLALKEADCSIAMASGSDVACRVAQIVLLRSDFSVMPSVVAEGRRVINNIQRSASLFLVKNIFSLLLAVFTLIFTWPYPFTASQLSLISMFTIGYPAFILAMEPNETRIKGKFLRNVFGNATPPALANFVLAIGLMLFYELFSLDFDMISTICTIVMFVVGWLVVLHISKPLNLLRKLLLASIIIVVIFCVIFLDGFFSLSGLNGGGILILVIFIILAVPALNLSYRLQGEIIARRDAKHGAKKA